jgi:hypothetical protein
MPESLRAGRFGVPRCRKIEPSLGGQTQIYSCLALKSSKLAPR